MDELTRAQYTLWKHSWSENAIGKCLPKKKTQMVNYDDYYPSIW